ncbi:MAG: hypothetical protein ABI599_18490 [Flavobacteriales bacterium]
MRTLLRSSLLLTSVTLCAAIATAGTVVLEGHYQGKNLFVQNPFSEAGVGFCVYEVTVNEMIATDEINSSAFEIDLGNYNLKLGAAVSVKIKHKDGCSPTVLNPEVLRPKSTFDIVSASVDASGTYKWVSTNETGELMFLVEQKRWNKWVRCGEVMGVGTPGEHAYEFKVTPHSGENTFRVKQVDSTKRPRYSEAVKYTDPSIAPVTFTPAKPSKEIVFSRATLYEIYDQYGNIVKRGYADKVDVSTMKKDLYYLNYDVKLGETFIKK